MNVSLPRLTFLSWAISSIRRSASGTPPGTAETRVGRPTAARWRVDALGLGPRQQAAPRREFERERHAERDRLAVQQPAGEAGGRLERVPEGVAEIEQRPLAGLALVAADDRRLHAAAHRDGVLARGSAGEHLLPVGLEPGEEGGVAEQPVFGDLGIAGAELARRQRIEQRGVGDHQHRLMKGADQVLAVPRIDRGLAADRGIDLRQQRGRYLHVVETAADDRGGEAGEIADHAAAERHHEVAALDARGDQRLADGFEHAESSSSSRPAARSRTWHAMPAAASAASVAAR